MSTFLHQPAKSASDLKRLVADRVPEGMHLDYKSKLWENKKKVTAAEEVAKDVTAFANAGGGDIIVGVQEDPHESVAVGFNPESGALGATAKVRKWLDNLVVPREVVSTIRIREVQVGVEDGAPWVLVVSVPPWPNGPVAVRTTKAGTAIRGRTHNDRLCFLFPFRDDDDSRFMEYDEVMVRTSGGQRRTYLRLKALLPDGHDCRIASNLRVDLVAGGSLPLQVRVHGKIIGITESTLRLDMTCTEGAIKASGVIGLGRAMTPGTLPELVQDGLPRMFWSLPESMLQEGAEQMLDEHRSLLENRMLVLPLSQIDDVWRRGDAEPLELLLKVDLVLNHLGWVIETRRPL